MPSRRLALLLALLWLIPDAARAQPPAEQRLGAPPSQGRGGRQGLPPRDGGPADTAARGTAVIRGVVLAADTGTPIRRAQVRATAPGIRENRLATTDVQGRFEFKELAAGRYTVNASKAGFVALQYGQRRPGESGTPLEISTAQIVDKLVVALPRGSVISGRIFDEFGEPVANAVVNALRYGYSGGSRRLLPTGGQNARDTSDDQGAFRLFGLPPGEYVVSANFRGSGGEVTDPSGEPSGYAPTYFPGTANVSDAQRVRIDVSQEQSSVNFGLIATRLVRIAGTVIDSKGAPVTTGALMLVPADSARGPMMMGGGAARLDRTGVFRITDVAPGRYVLQTRTNMGRGAAGAAESEFARLDLAVGAQDLDGIVLVTAPGARVSGQIVSESAQATTLRPDQLQISARSARPDQMGFAGAGATARVAADGTFTIDGLFDPALFRVSGAQGWSIKQVLLNGQDITDTPLDLPPGQTIADVRIVITDKTTTVSGAVTDSRGQPVVDASVIVFPADEKRWTYQTRFIRAARPDQDGRYEISGLPANSDYLIAVVQGLEDGQAGDPEFLTRIKGDAARLSLSDGETKVADVKLPAAR
jgi:protocatechuate 3,4-dioxygenase beta subunit